MNVCIPPTPIPRVAGSTVMVVRTGTSTVTLAVPVTVPLVAFTIVVPVAFAVKNPVLLTVPTVVLLLPHAKSTPIILFPT